MCAPNSIYHFFEATWIQSTMLCRHETKVYWHTTCLQQWIISFAWCSLYQQKLPKRIRSGRAIKEVDLPIVDPSKRLFRPGIGAYCEANLLVEIRNHRDWHTSCGPAWHEVMVRCEWVAMWSKCACGFTDLYCPEFYNVLFPWILSFQYCSGSWSYIVCTWHLQTKVRASDVGTSLALATFVVLATWC